jgi:hypothetical protein
MTKSWADIAREIHTDNRIPIAEKAAFAGGNSLRIDCQEEEEQKLQDLHD